LDEISRLDDLGVCTRVNGVVRQHDRTSNMLFAFAEILAAVSAATALHPGDVVLTGSPAGSGIGDGIFLSPGDIVEVDGEQIGLIRSHVTPVPPARG
jgi:2-keto-4-pentenoate hydratase/2-oxohepta-3-ene-1,7-dioic acid hydratase in catechol pathway